MTNRLGHPLGNPVTGESLSSRSEARDLLWPFGGSRQGTTSVVSKCRAGPGFQPLTDASMNRIQKFLRKTPHMRRARIAIRAPSTTITCRSHPRQFRHRIKIFSRLRIPPQPTSNSPRAAEDRILRIARHKRLRYVKRLLILLLVRPIIPRQIKSRIHGQQHAVFDAHSNLP